MLRTASRRFNFPELNSSKPEPLKFDTESCLPARYVVTSPVVYASAAICRPLPALTVVKVRLLPVTESLRIVFDPRSMVGLPAPLLDTVKFPCLAASCVVSVEVNVYALTAAAMLVATSLALTPAAELLIDRSPSTSARETPVPALILRRVDPESKASPVDPELLLSVFCFAFSSVSTCASVLP